MGTNFSTVAEKSCVMLEGRTPLGTDYYCGVCYLERIAAVGVRYLEQIATVGCAT